MFESGTQQEDGPVTWEALTFPRGRTVRGSRQDCEISDVPALMGARWKADKKSHPPPGRPKARGTGAGDRKTLGSRRAEYEL